MHVEMVDELRARQWETLSRVLHDAWSCSPFHRERLIHAGCSDVAQITSLEEFIKAVPYLEKKDLVEEQTLYPPYGRIGTGTEKFFARFSQTSGTSGAPLMIWDTDLSWNWMLENWVEGLRMAGLKAGSKAYFAFSFGPFLGFWTAYDAALRMGLRCLPGGGLSSRARLAAMLKHKVEVLFCTPTYALHMLDVAQLEGISAEEIGIKHLLVAGEPGGSLTSVRERLEEGWGNAEVIDHYGMTEVGPVAFAKSGDNLRGLWVLEDRYLAEVIDPATGTSVSDGTVGELVLTPLGREAWPMFRYRTGDLVCAKRVNGKMLLEGGVLGRRDDMRIVRGVNVYPGAVDGVIRRFKEVGEYRVVERKCGALVEISLEIEVIAGEGVAKQLEAAFEETLALRVPVHVVESGSLPRFEMKAKRWIKMP